VKREKNADPEMRAFFDEMETKGSIDPKDAFFGGRTCVHKIHAEANDEFEIFYVDIISLYPFINGTFKYPIKVPEIIRPEDPVVDWSLPEHIEHDGLYKVRVVPPRGLFLPVLPMRVNRDDPRLMFMLCNRCATSMSRIKDGPVVKKAIQCKHTDEERGWTATMTSIELRVALREGYKIDRCYRIWKYNEFDNLFWEYVKTFMEMKIKSSGFPSEIKTDEEKKKWAKGWCKLSIFVSICTRLEYYDRLGIKIALADVKLNPGLRYISKLLLNSLWGKFGQRNNLTKNRVLKNPSDYFALVFDKNIEVSQILPVNEDTIRVTYLERESLVKENATSNVVVALNTTRLFLSLLRT
jgi:hypothetical protein